MSIGFGDMQDIVAFNTIKQISSPDDGKNTKGYREIALGVADKDKQDMYLKLRDEKHTWNNLYLGRSRTFKKGKSEKQWNMVVPIVPRCYTTPDRDPAHADHPGKGWIYIIRKFRNPKKAKDEVELWRELRSDGLGNFSDVQLKYQRGRDHRPATGQPGFRIIVPYRIDNQVHELWIAFSEVQWSWARIEQMTKDADRKDADLREKRMHKLDLSGCLDNFSQCEPAPAEDGDRSDDPESTQVKDVSGKALIHRLDLATDDNSKNLPEDFKDPIPVVYLDDPVGIARELAARYQLNCALMDAKVKEMNKLSEQAGKSKKGADCDPIRWLKSAVVFNTYLNTKVSENYKNVRHIEKELEDLYQKKIDLRNYIARQPTGKFSSFSTQQRNEKYAELKSIDARIRKQERAKSKLYKSEGSEIRAYKEFTENIADLRNKINEDALKKALRVTERAELRRNIIDSKKNLTDFLAHELDTLQESPLLRALDDHFTLPTHCPHGKVIKELPNNLPRGMEQETSQDDTEKPEKQQQEIKPQRVWPNWHIDAWSAVAGIFGWLDKHEYAFDAELETNIDGWALRRNDAGVELLRKLLDPRENLPLHKRLYPNRDASDPLTPAEYPDDNPAYYVLNRFRELTNHDKKDRKFATEEITQVMTRFLKGLVEVYCMGDRSQPDYEESIACCQETILRTFREITGIELKEKNIDARQYRDYIRFAKEQHDKDKAGFPELRKFFIMAGKCGEKFLDGRIKDATKTLQAAPVSSHVQGTSNGRIVGMSPDNKDFKTRITNDRHGGFGSAEKKAAIAAHGGSKNVPSVKDIPVATQTGTTSVKTRTKGQKKLWYDMTVVTTLSDEGRDRYIKRVGASKTANLAAKGLLSIIEIINVKRSIDAFLAETDERKNFDHVLAIIDSSLSLVSSFGEVKEAGAKMRSAGAYAERSTARAAKLAADIGKGWAVAGLASTCLDVYFAYNSMMENIHQGDDAYIGDAVIISGGVLSIIGGAAELLVVAGTTSPLAPLVVIGTIVVFLGYAIRAWIFPESKPIGLWAEHGPFGKVPFMGYNHGASMKRQSLTEQRGADWYVNKEINERYIAWCDHPEEAYRAVRDALFRPTIEMSSSRANMAQLISVKVKVPFRTKKSYLTIQCQHTEQSWAKRNGEYVSIEYAQYIEDNYPSTASQFEDHEKKTEKITYVDNPADLKKQIPGNRPLTDLKEGPPGTFHIQFINHSKSTVTVRVRLQVTDDGEFVIPYESAYDDAGELHWVAKKDRFFNH